MDRVLVVDDDRELRENMAEVLSAAGFSVAVAGSAEQAIATMEKEMFDLVLLDLGMPGMTGMEALGQMKKNHPQTRVVMITAFATVENAVEAMRQGADDYVSKPFRVGDLLSTARRIIEEAKFRRCHLLFNMESVFNCLANGMRRKILVVIHRQGSSRFMDIVRELEVEDHTKVNFHLKILREAELICQTEKKLYDLTPEGKQIVECFDYLGKVLSS